MAHNLLQLPGEVLHNILAYVRPEDLPALRCCHSLNEFINHDGLLFKEIYLQHYVCQNRIASTESNNRFAIGSPRYSRQIRLAERTSETDTLQEDIVFTQ